MRTQGPDLFRPGRSCPDFVYFVCTGNIQEIFRKYLENILSSLPVERSAWGLHGLQRSHGGKLRKSASLGAFLGLGLTGQSDSQAGPRGLGRD